MKGWELFDKCVEAHVLVIMDKITREEGDRLLSMLSSGNSSDRDLAVEMLNNLK